MQAIMVWLVAMSTPWAASTGEHPEIKSRAFHFTYEAQMTDIPEMSESVLMWVPLPVTTTLQTIKGMNIVSSHPYNIVTDETYGNRFVRIELTDTQIQALEVPPHITLNFDVVRKAMVPMYTPFAMPNIDRSKLDQYLADSILVVSTGPIEAEAARIVANETDTLKQAQLLYDNIVDTVTYDKSGDGWGRGDSLYVCDVRTGNCTDFHSLFIGQARSLNIPARFIMGFPIPIGPKEGDISGYHCWAEFFHNERGWLPVDASEAQKHPEMREALFCGLDENRIQFTQGRDIVLPMAKGGPLNYAIYPYAEVDGKIHTSFKTRFHFKDAE